MRIKGVNIIVALLFVVFGWSSWIDINGLWVELPILVNRLPEGWNLPAYFTVIIQLANIGPLLYGILANKCINDKNKLETVAIYIIIIIGCLSLLFLAFFWHKTSIIGGENHSTVLLILTFFLSLVDCTSSVTFLPFMAQFMPCYMTAFYIGEGMSGLLPTAIAFIQGAGEYSCVNTSSNSTSNIQPVYTDLLFPVKDFFVTLFIMLIMSLIAFAILKYSPYCKSERKDQNDENKVYSPALKNQDGHDTDVDLCHSESPILSSKSNLKEHSFREYITLLVIMACISALSNGVLPSVQTYSLLPYGHIYYSLAVKLSQFANPLACFIGFCAVPRSKLLIGVLTSVAIIASIYILSIASYSPTPPVQGTFAGVFMILVWILFTAVVSYLKVLISNLLLKEGYSALFWLGVSTQIGSCFGAIVTFVCVTVLQLLESAPPCVS